MTSAVAFARIGAAQDRELAIMIAASALTHILLFCLLVFWPTSPPKTIGWQIMEAELVPGVRTSPAPLGQEDAKLQVAEPEPEKKEPEPAPVKEAPPVEKTKTDEVPLPTTNKAELTKEKEKPKEPELSLSDRITAIRDKAKGRQRGFEEGIPGTQATPGSGIEDKIVALYLAKLKDKVEQSWVRPVGVSPGADLQVTVRFRIDEAGGVVAPRMTRSSGLSVADQSAMRALLKAAPFDRPAPRVLDALEREGGIELTFDFNQ
jgi:TonB family protein